MQMASNVQDPAASDLLKPADDSNMIVKVKVMVNLMWSFSIFASRWRIGDEKLQLHFRHVDDAVRNLIWDVEAPGNYKKGSGSSAMEEDFAVSKLTKLTQIKQDVEQIYAVFCMSSSPRYVVPTSSYVVSFILSLLRNMKDISSCQVPLIMPVTEQIEELEKKLTDFKILLAFIEKSCLLKDPNICSYAGDVAIRATCLLYLCLVEDEMDENMVREMENKISGLLKKIDPLELKVRKIFIRALKTSRSIGPLNPVIDEHDLDFTDVLIENLKEISKNQRNSVAAKEGRIEVILEELILLRCYLMDPPLQARDRELENLLSLTKAVISETGSIVYSSCGNEENEDAPEELNCVVSDLLANVACINEHIRSLYDGSSLVISQMSPGPSFQMDSAIDMICVGEKNGKVQINDQLSSTDPLKKQMTRVYEELMSLSDNFSRIPMEWKHNTEFKVLLSHYENVENHVQHVHDLYAKRSTSSLWFDQFGLFIAAKELLQVKKELKAFTGRRREQIVFQNIEQGVSSQADPPETDAMVVSMDDMGSKGEESTKEIVGFKEDAREIMDKLTRGSTQRKIISIVGMPGLGKTTLAHFVFKHMSINLHFHVRAWCCVSQDYEKKTLLAELLCQITGEANKSHDDKGEDSAEKLYKSLKGQKYLVVLDDIWELKAWADLMECFPDDSNGSRILITTRHQNVAVLTSSIHHSLNLLSDYESWKLLQDSIFQKETCPPELIEVVKSIAKDCKGLPLVVVLVAGVLKKTERKRDCWEQVAKQLGSNKVAYIGGQHLATLELSYRYLPDYLKPCFLYFGSFSKHKEIPVRKLLRQWIAEGFVQQPKMAINSLEHEAENYLNDLVDRSLVMIAKRSSIGRTKACRIHDLLLDFCLEKAKKQSIMQRLAGHHELSSSGGSLIHSTDPDNWRFLALRLSVPSFPSLIRARGPDGYFAPDAGKLVVSGSSMYLHATTNRDGPLLFTASSSSSRGTRSYSVQQASDPRLSSFKPVSLNHFESKFGLLKVLDLGNVPIEGCANTHDLVLIAQLVELRYLAVRICTKEIPSEIANLLNLENLTVKGAIGEVILPDAIWDMVRLRHIHIIGAFFRFQHHSQESFDKNPFGMSNLKTISTVSLNHGSNVSTIMLGRLSGLQKLRCIFRKCWDKCNSFPELSCLSQLESLKVCFFGKVHSPSKFSFPANLKKLTLSNFQLPWNESSTIGRLPNLEVLKLSDRAFEGQQWEMNEGEFQNLKFLKLDLLNITTWIVSSEHLPSLEQLVLHRCKLLQEIPSSLGEIPTLQVIEMRGCCPSAIDSVKLIQKEQSDLGNDQLEVYI